MSTARTTGPAGRAEGLDRPGDRPVPTTRRGGSPRRQRAWLRGVHLVVGTLLATYVYLPGYLPGVDALRWALMVLGVPAVLVSGLLIWQQARARRLLARWSRPARDGSVVGRR